MKDMQKMNKKTGVLLGFSVGASALIAAACSSDPNPTTPITPQPTASTTGTNTTTTTTPTTTSPTSNTVTPTSSSSTSTNTTTTAPVEMPSACTETTYANGNIGNENAMFSAVRSIYVYGDAVTSACTDDTTTPGTVCVEGNAVASDGGDAATTDDYKNWGAGIGLQLAETDGDGVLVAAWDATTAGAAPITQLRFTVSNLTASRPLRVQISNIDNPAITTAADNYQANGFMWGGSATTKAKEGVNTIPLTDFELPSWAVTNIERGLGAALPEGAEILDPTKIHSLQFQIANNPKDDPEMYKFCLSQVEWLDAAGNVVAVTVVETPGDTGSDTGSDTSGAVSGGSDTSAPAGSSGGGGDSSAPADSSGADTGAAVVNFQADVQPIFAASCGAAACHDADAPAHGLALTGTEPNATVAGDILRSVKREQGIDAMPPPPAAALPADQIEKIEAWVNSL
jgi:hypothetical protein